MGMAQLVVTAVLGQGRSKAEVARRVADQAATNASGGLGRR